MTTSVHSTLTGADLHESKGVATALNGQVYVANGSGSGVWTAASSVITNTAFTTGDLKPTHKTVADSSWILWSDGTIGDGSSAATIRANADTAALFAVYYNGYSDALCPVSGGRGANAAADYAAHKTIALPLGAGRAFGLAGSGATLTTRTLGATTGAETYTILTANLPAYTPSGTVALNNGISSSGALILGAGGNERGTVSGANYLAISATFTGSAQGGTSTPHTIMNPTAYVNMMIKL